MTPEEKIEAAKVIDGGWITMDEGAPRLNTRLLVSSERLVGVQILLNVIGGNLGRKNGLYWWTYGGMRAVKLLESLVEHLDRRKKDAQMVIEASQSEPDRRTQLVDELFAMNLSRAHEITREHWPWMFQVEREVWKEKRILRDQTKERGTYY